jgi:uncharacterized protein
VKIVLDTNILVRAANGPRGMAMELVNLAITPPHHLLLSQFLVAEVNRVLRYPRVLKQHQLPEPAMQKFVDVLVQSSDLIELTDDSGITICVDADDNHLIALAIAGTADVICTRDRHLLAPQVREFLHHQQVEVVSDVDLLQRLRDQ